MQNKFSNIELNKQKFAIKLHELMKEKFYSNMDLERETGIPNQTISAYLTKKSEPKLTNLLILSEFFGCTIDELTNKTEY